MFNATKGNKRTHLVMSSFIWWLLPDSNWGHAALQAAALPAELKSRGMCSPYNTGERPLLQGVNPSYRGYFRSEHPTYRAGRQSVQQGIGTLSFDLVQC